MKLLSIVAFAAICIATGTAHPGNLSEWVGHQRRNFNPDGQGRDVGLYGPAGIVTDGKTFYVAEEYNSAVRNITLDGVTTTMVGGDGAGSRDGYWNETRVYNPSSVALSWDNATLYVGGQHGVLRIDVATSNSTTIVDNGANFRLAVDANNTLWVAVGSRIYLNWRANDFGNYELHGTNQHLAFGQNSGFSDGVGLDSQFQEISGIEVHYPEPEDLSKTMLIIADYQAHTIRGAHTGNQSVVTLAGVPGSASFQDGPRGKGMLSYPRAITVPMRGKAKHAYVASYNAIRRLDIVSGELTTILGRAQGQGLVYSVNPYKAAFGNVKGIVEADNRLFISLLDFNTIATLQLNFSEEFNPDSAVAPTAGVVALAALVASLLL